MKLSLVVPRFHWKTPTPAVPDRAPPHKPAIRAHLVRHPCTLYHPTLSDIYTCYKVFKREQVVGLNVQSDGFEYDAEFLAILLKRDLVVYEVPISYYGRSYGEGKKIKWYHTVRVIWNLIKYRFV